MEFHSIGLAALTAAALMVAKRKAEATEQADSQANSVPLPGSRATKAFDRLITRNSGSGSPGAARPNGQGAIGLRKSSN